MYKILGADGKEYGPVSLEQLQRWQAEGRINARTRVKADGAMDWKEAAEFPELGFSNAFGASGGGVSQPPDLLPGQIAGQGKGLAIASFVLGLFSLFLCFLGPILGIPAIICGHLAHHRTRRSPGRTGAPGFAIAGFVMGYCSVVVALVSFALYTTYAPLFKRAKGSPSIHCMNNMKQIGLAFRVWALDNKDQFPFNVSTNAGGTLEYCLLGTDGFDQNAALHFQIMSNELSIPKLLVCPSDLKRQPSVSFASLQPVNVSYQLYSGTNLTDANPQQILAICPIHGHILRCDGSVSGVPKPRK